LESVSIASFLTIFCSGLNSDSKSILVEGKDSREGRTSFNSRYPYAKGRYISSSTIL